MTTTEIAIYDRTWHDVVRDIWGPVTDKFADYLLWERTAFPMDDEAGITSSLMEVRAAYFRGMTPCCRCGSDTLIGTGLEMCDRCEGFMFAIYGY